MQAHNTRYIVEGGRKLEGSIMIQSAKNAISKQLVASVLTNEPCILENVPRITEVDGVLAMLGELGTSYEWISDDTLLVQTPDIEANLVPLEYSGFNRIPILMLGPLVHRAGSVTVPIVGGDDIGSRPVNFHTRALRDMGVEIESNGDSYTAKSSGITGTTIELPYPSVGATENVILTATLAEGTTVIKNAAIEPEIIDTILFLQKMGALIRVDVDRKIIIEGVAKLHGARHRPIADRIEAASYAALALATDGNITIRNAQQQHMITFLNALLKVGGGFKVKDEGIAFFRASDELSPIHIETDVHPGFMTDWQQPFVVMLTQAQGVSIIHETVYENRFGYTKALRQMGANIDLTTACLGSKPCRFKDRDHLHSAIIRGVTPLNGTQVEIPDLRAGFAYLMAGLVAEGETELTNVHYMERGYANIVDKMASIGAQLRVATTA
ncbi:MAG: UDP-N-acetylglucosamine 1-carboxyvinyltransferase [Chloroflexota bacterium]